MLERLTGEEGKNSIALLWIHDVGLACPFLESSNGVVVLARGGADAGTLSQSYPMVWWC
jgi:hypothetical protein